MRIWLVLAVALALCCGYLGYRVIALEQRVAIVAKQLGAPPPNVASGGAQDAHGRRADHEQRIGTLEQDLRALREDLQTLEEATADFTGAQLQPSAAAGDPGADQRILSVLGREQNRIRDRQLDFHRARWLEWRQSALESFAESQGLTPAQTDQLHKLLTAEVDQLVEILRRPDSVENPDRAANDWLDRLEATDRDAQRVLAATQVPAWNTARSVERRVFWPWLPNR